MSVEQEKMPAQEARTDIEELKDHNIQNSEVLVDKELMTNAFEGENREHEETLWQAAKSHPMACFWAFIMCFTIVGATTGPQSFLQMSLTVEQVMESFDMFLNGNFVALNRFKEVYGVQHDGEWVIPTKWQSALFQSGQCGAFVGVFLAGPITNRLGYRWTTILALILMNATIFISFFVSTARVLLESLD